MPVPEGRRRPLTSIWGACGRAIQKAWRSWHTQVGHRNIAVAVHAVAGGAVIRLLRRGAGGVAPRGDAACVANVSLTTEETGQVNKAVPTIGPNVAGACPHPDQNATTAKQQREAELACRTLFLIDR